MNDDDDDDDDDSRDDGDDDDGRDDGDDDGSGRGFNQERVDVEGLGAFLKERRRAHNLLKLA
jgi:hypothetical protein